MGERIYFATSNWKDKPDKPSCYTQAQWDAMNSSKFNGAPFASSFALTDTQITSLKVKGIEQGDFNAYKNAVQAIKLGNCPAYDCNQTPEGCLGKGSRLRQDEQNLPELKEKDITVQCEDIKMKVWDGSTYYDRSGASKEFTWDTCGAPGAGTGSPGSGRPNRYTVGIRDFKAPSARSDVYIPVCGPGTHILEITKDQLMQIVWRISQFDLQASGISVEVSQNTTWTNHYSPNGGGSVKSKGTATTSNKDLNPTIPSPGSESAILNLSWIAGEVMGYSGDETENADGTKSGTSNGNVTASVEITGEDYEMFYSTASSHIEVSLLPFTSRHQYIYFVADATSGVEKIYFDPTGLFKFDIACNGGYYGLDPANILAEHSITLNFLGKIYTIYISGPTNNAFTIVNREVNVNFDAGATITITGKKYYPYANSKGEAVYDADTGAQLKDPVS